MSDETRPLASGKARGVVLGIVLGIVLYDGQCGICSRWAQYWAPMLRRHGFEIGSLDESWVAEKLQMLREELLTDIRLLTTEGQLISGAEVYLYVTRRIWWAWLFYAIFSLPGFHWMIHAGYRWFARNRHYVSHACGLR